MKRALILAAAMALVTPAAIAGSNEISRGEPFAIRSCPEGFGESFVDVCYNQITSVLVWVGPLPTPISRSKERVIQVNCDRRRDYRAGSTRAEIAAEYCPQVDSLPNIISMASN